MLAKRTDEFRHRWRPLNDGWYCRRCLCGKIGMQIIDPRAQLRLYRCIDFRQEYGVQGECKEACHVGILSRFLWSNAKRFMPKHLWPYLKEECLFDGMKIKITYSPGNLNNA